MMEDPQEFKHPV